MQSLIFVTSNANKAREAQEIMPFTIEQRKLDLPEIQSLSLQEIIEAKLNEAYETCRQPVFVEDGSAELEALNGLPGPFIKFFEEQLGSSALHILLKGHEDKRATLVVMIGLHDGANQHYFTGKLHGTIVSPRGENGFGFDTVFMPDGHTKTMAQMTATEKNSLSHRKLALQKLVDFLEA